MAGQRDAFERAKMQARLDGAAEGDPRMAGIKVYQGPFPELDLALDWYCPYCIEAGRKLIRTSNLATVYCPNHQSCEYDFSNSRERDRRQEVWHEGYRLPLTLKELTRRQIALKEEQIEDTKRGIQNAMSRVTRLTEEVAKLKAGLRTKG